MPLLNWFLHDRVVTFVTFDSGLYQLSGKSIFPDVYLNGMWSMVIKDDFLLSVGRAMFHLEHVYICTIMYI